MRGQTGVLLCFLLASLLAAWPRCWLVCWSAWWQVVRSARCAGRNFACQISFLWITFPLMIIALVNSKGGVGKSTIAGNLAGWLQKQGRSVILADCDTQKSSSEWVREAAPGIELYRLETSDEILDELPSLKSQADFIVADGPGSQTEVSRALLMWADLAIIPCKASMFEARALDKNTAFVRQAQAIRNGAPNAVAVLSMVGRDYRLTKDMRESGFRVATRYCTDFSFAPAGLRRCAGAGNIRLGNGLFRPRCCRRNRAAIR